MRVFRYPEQATWDSIVTRPSLDTRQTEERVLPILEAVRTQGDAAVKEFTMRFDGAMPEALLVTDQERKQAAALLSEELKAAIRQAYANIKKFHEAQREAEVVVETMPGVRCWRRSVAIQRVGIYVPGGTAPLFSTVLMLAVPAAVAGCPEIVMCTPPAKDGSVNPAILFTADLAGVHKIYKIGGAQAVAAMAYGTEAVPRVDKIFGPGNQYVTVAKQLVSKEGVAIDMPAGPSEVLVIADATANPAYVAVDLLSQAEHGADSHVMLVTDSETLLMAVQEEVARQLAELPRRALAEPALEHSRLILVRDLNEAVALSNRYAPEHLIMAVSEAEAWSEQVVNAGSVFLGHLTPESVGDYASGTNHTLPTNGYARAYSGVSLDSFIKKITYQRLSAQGLQHLGRHVAHMAEAESLDAHKNAVLLRLQDLD